jgi:hypothetical protein
VKTLWRTVGSILVCLILLLLVLRITGLEPQGRRPGLWLKGDLVITPVTDWSFTDQYPTIKLETRTWYLLPHSVTINCVAYNGQLYLTSTFPARTQRGWNDNVVRDPHVRLKIGEKLYDRKAELVTNPDEQEGELQARAKKYPRLKIAPNATIHVFHIGE